MAPEEARKLVLDEAFAEDGIVVCAHLGDDPGPHRMDRLLAALRVVGHYWRHQRVMERSLACALYCLAAYVQQNLWTWSEQGKRWRPRLLEWELPELLAGVEDALAGQHVGTHDADSRAG